MDWERERKGSQGLGSESRIGLALKVVRVCGVAWVWLIITPFLDQDHSPWLWEHAVKGGAGCGGSCFPPACACAHCAHAPPPPPSPRRATRPRWGTGRGPSHEPAQLLWGRGTNKKSRQSERLCSYLISSKPTWAPLEGGLPRPPRPPSPLPTERCARTILPICLLDCTTTNSWHIQLRSQSHLTASYDQGC